MRSDQLPSTFDGFYPLVHPRGPGKAPPEDVGAGSAPSHRQEHENQFRIVRPDGAVRTVHNQARVHRDESGEAVRVIGVCQDITERKLAEEQMRRLPGGASA